MNLLAIRNYLYLLRGMTYSFVLTAFIIVIVISLCFSLWLTALVVFLAMLLYGYLNYPVFVLISKIGTAHQATKEARFADADAILREALVLVEATGPDHPCLGIIYLELSMATRNQGNYTDAETFGRQAVETLEGLWEPCHPFTIQAVESLANIYLDIARFSQAQALLERAISARDTRGEAASSEFALALKNLGRLHLRQDRLTNAELLCQRAYDMLRQIPSPPSYPGLATASDLAAVRVKQKKFKEAEALAQSAWDQVQKVTPPDPYLVALGLNLVATVWFAQARYPEAEEKSRQALALIDKFHKPNDPKRAMFLHLLASILVKQERWSDAEPLCRESLGLREEYLAPEDPYVADSLDLTAEVLARLGKNTEAEGYSHRARQIWDFHSPLRIV